MQLRWIIRPVVTMLGLALTVPGCNTRLNDPAWATRPYPRELHTTKIVDMQVVRRGTRIEVMNATADSYRDVELWINGRYVSRVAGLPAGERTDLSLWDFHDEFGDRFNAGGLFRTSEPTPVRLVEIQQSPQQPMVGLVTIRAEPVRVAAERR